MTLPWKVYVVISVMVHYSAWERGHFGGWQHDNYGIKPQDQNFNLLQFGCEWVSISVLFRYRNCQTSANPETGELKRQCIFPRHTQHTTLRWGNDRQQTIPFRMGQGYRSTNTEVLYSNSEIQMSHVVSSPPWGWEVFPILPLRVVSLLTSALHSTSWALVLTFSKALLFIEEMVCTGTWVAFSGDCVAFTLNQLYLFQFKLAKFKLPMLWTW